MDRRKKAKIVVFTGAGISAESGLSTFRDKDGLWKYYPVHEIAIKKTFEPKTLMTRMKEPAALELFICTDKSIGLKAVLSPP